MFYDKFAALCKERGISVSRGALEAGISKSLVTKWKNNQTDMPSTEVLNKISKAFNVPLSELLGEIPVPPKAEQTSVIDREHLKFALFQGRETVTDAMLEEVLSFAEYVAHREEARNR